MAYIKIFKASNDSEVSPPPATTNAVKYTLRADLNDIGEWIKLYLLADEGYEVSDVEVELIDNSPEPQTETNLKWQLAADNDGEPSETPEEYGASLEISETIGDTDEVYFWIRAKATDDESPIKDLAVTLYAHGLAAEKEEES